MRTDFIAIGAIVALTRLDMLRDKYVGVSLESFWRKPRKLPLTGRTSDFWHILIKWPSFYGPLLYIGWMNFGIDWRAWWISIVLSVIAWRWGAPWKSTWF